MKKRSIIAVTGTRSDYGPMRPVFKAIGASNTLQLGLIVTGMHLLPEHGSTVREIERDEFPILRRVSMLLAEDSGLAMAKGLGLGILGIAQALEELRPDMLLLQGDRGEMLAAAIASAHANIPVCHMSGGDSSGSIDDSIRHAITKFAHLHLVTCEESARQVEAMGEVHARIFVVGEPTLDVIRQFEPIPPAQLGKQLDLDLTRPLIVAIQHAVTSEVDRAADQMRETLEALVKLREQVLFFHPNSDPGGQAMAQVLESYQGYDFIHEARHIHHEAFLSLMRVAQVMVGNSSSGIIEAPSFHLPVVNIGTRQTGRVRAANVIDVGYDRGQIAAAIERALRDSAFRQKVKNCVNPYGDGHTSEHVVDILNRVRLVPKLTAKWLPAARFVE